MALITAGSGVLCVGGLVIAIAILFQESWFQMWFLEKVVQQHGQANLQPPPIPENPYTGPYYSALDVQSADELFRPTNIWEAHLRFTAEEWNGITPNRVEPLADWMAPDGTPILRNPNASRAGIAGVFGWDFPLSTSTFEFGGLVFTNVATRFKGNGTFLSGLGSYRRPFKLDLDKHAPDQRLAGRSTINLHNLEADRTFLSDTLGYEFFREAGVPAPRTTFLRLYLTIEGRFDRQVLGLYLMVENPDKEWIRETFSRDDVALFKPVTHHFLESLGKDWASYEEIYDPKTKPSPAQQQRLIELCELTSNASDPEFNQRIGEFLDLRQAATFFACLTLTSSYDSILDNGQNFLFWHDPGSNRFGFSPWDLDHSWGEFPHVGRPEDRIRASLFRPWVGEKLFLERLFNAPEFVEHYRAELHRLLDTLFVPERLSRRIDEVATAIRPAVAELGPRRLTEFSTAIADYSDADTDGTANRRRSVHQLKRFIVRRAEEARAQLEGRSEGVIIRRR